MWNQLKFGKAFLAIVRNPQRTEQIFKMAEIGLKEKEQRLARPVINRVKGQPAFVSRYERRFLPPAICLEALEAMAEDTLGWVYAKHMRDNNLDVDFFPVPEPKDLIHYTSLRARQSHDLWHVLAGYGTTVKDELALQGFTYAQLHAGVSVSILAAGMLHVLIREPLELNPTFVAVVEGYLRGRDCKFLLGLPLEEMWARPLTEVRAYCGIAAPTQESG